VIYITRAEQNITQYSGFSAPKKNEPEIPQLWQRPPSSPAAFLEFASSGLNFFVSHFWRRLNPIPCTENFKEKLSVIAIWMPKAGKKRVGVNGLSCLGRRKTNVSHAE